MGDVVRMTPRPKPRETISVEKAAEATRRLDGLVAAVPQLEDALEPARVALIEQRERAPKWRFIMLGPVENAAVLYRIVGESKRPSVATRLWGAILCHIEADTGAIKMSRKTMLDAAGTKHWHHVKLALDELTAWGALKKAEDQEQWFCNPRLATHLSKVMRPVEQRRATPVVQLSPPTRRKKIKAPDDDNGGPIRDRRQPELID
jgi:hypothetical protein